MEKKKFVKKNLVNILIGLVSACLAFFVVCPILLMLVYSFETSRDETPELVYAESFPLQALKDNQFALSNTHSDKVSYLRQIGSETVSEYVYTNEASFIETNEKPHVKVYYKYPDRKTEFFQSLSNILLRDETPGFTYEKYVFHIPEGSLTTEYEIDLE